MKKSEAQTAPPGCVVAVFNSNQDIIDLLRMTLEAEGFITVTGHVADVRDGKMDWRSFMEQHRPHVVIRDIAPMYEENWRFFATVIRPHPASKQCSFVLTTTNEKGVADITSEPFIKIVGKPFELMTLLQAVASACCASPSMTCDDRAPATV